MTARGDADAGAHATSIRKLVHLLWLTNAMLVAFVVPWTMSRVLPADHRAVVAIDIAVGSWFVVAYVRTARPSTQALRARHAWSLALGVIVGLVASFVVVALLRSTARPSGLDLAVAVLGRGVLHGIVVAAVTVGVPVAVAHQLVVDAPSAVRTVARMVVSLVFVWAVSTAHHIGFEQYESVDVRPAQATAMTTSLPAVITGNPLGAVVANVAVRVTATVHAFEDPHLVPPRLEVVRTYQPPGLFPPELRPMGDRVIG